MYMYGSIWLTTLCPLRSNLLHVGSFPEACNCVFIDRVDLRIGTMMAGLLGVNCAKIFKDI